MYGTAASARLKGKTVFITGATSGIGKQTAITFAEITTGDIKFVLTARRMERLQLFKADLESKFENIKVLPLTMDVSSTKSINEAIESIPPEFKQVDILINNAGLALGRDHVGKMEDDDITIMINTNVTGLIYLTHKFVPGMRERNCGDIVNVGSIAGRNPYPGGAVYCSTKVAVKYFSTCLRKELIDTKVRVMEFAPGEVETEFSLVRYKGNEETAKNVYKNKAPLEADDIADMIVFACSRKTKVVLAEALILPTYQ